MDGYVHVQRGHIRACSVTEREDPSTCADSNNARSWRLSRRRMKDLKKRGCSDEQRHRKGGCLIQEMWVPRVASVAPRRTWGTPDSAARTCYASSNMRT